MMFHFPYFGIPYYNRYSRYGYRYPYYTYNSKYNDSANKNSSSNMNTKKNTNTYNNSNLNNTCKSKNIHNTIKKVEHSNFNEDTPLFQLFGVNLYFDDIMLVCLIWFLYEEGVKDEGLFITLILLLLS